MRCNLWGVEAGIRRQTRLRAKVPPKLDLVIKQLTYIVFSVREGRFVVGLGRLLHLDCRGSSSCSVLLLLYLRLSLFGHSDYRFE